MLKERRRHVAVVTGGGRGIGRQVAVRLRDRGMEVELHSIAAARDASQVVVAARTEAELLAVAKETGAVPFVADVSKSSQVME